MTMVKWEDVQDDYARKDAEIDALRTGKMYAKKLDSEEWARGFFVKKHDLRGGNCIVSTGGWWHPVEVDTLTTIAPKGYHSCGT